MKSQEQNIDKKQQNTERLIVSFYGACLLLMILTYSGIDFISNKQDCVVKSRNDKTNKMYVQNLADTSKYYVVDYGPVTKRRQVKELALPCIKVGDTLECRIGYSPNTKKLFYDTDVTRINGKNFDRFVRQQKTR
jgi:hypothetical protein